MYPNISIHNQQHFSNETMLKSLNNNASPFSMDNLLSKMPPSGKTTPETPDGDRNQPEHDANSTDGARSQPESDRLSPNEKQDVFFGFSGCFKNRICSNCGQIDCNLLHCRMQGVSSENSVKDAKPVLKFSVSAILGTDNQTRSIQNGKIYYVHYLFYYKCAYK